MRTLKNALPALARRPLAGLAVFVVVALTVLAMPAPALAAPTPSLAASRLETAPGVVRFLLTASGLPLNTPIDPANVAVRVGETTLVSNAEKVSRSATKLPPRGLMVVLDVSGSVAGARLAAAQNAVRELASNLPEDVQVGLIAVSDAPRLVLKPTEDRAALTNATSALRGDGNTALYDAVALAATALRQAKFGPDSERRVLVLSDGLDTASKMSLSQLQSRLRSEKLAVDVVAFQADKVGLDALQDIAVIGDGRVLTAPEATFVADSFRAVAGGFSVVLAVEAVVPAGLSDKQETLVVSLETTAGTLTTKVPVTFAAGPPVRVAGAPRLGWIPVWAPWALGGTFFLGGIGLVVALVWPRSKKKDRIGQIEQFEPGRVKSLKTRNVEPTSALTRAALSASAAIVRSGDLEQRIALRLDQAGMRLRPHEWVLLRACGAIPPAAVLFLVFGHPFWRWAGLVIGGLLGWLATGMYRSIRADRRAASFAEQLPDALQLVIGSLRSGFSLQQAIDALVREAPEPVAAEFGRALAENRLGADLSDALDGVARRAQSDDLGWAVMAVRIQREVGGNLAEVLQTTVDTIRERGRLRRHVKSLSAEGRLSAWVLIAIPILLGGFFFTFRRAYLRLLYTEPIGIAMLLVGLVLLVVGIFWMSRTVKVEA